MNFKRKQFLKLLDAILAEEKEQVVLAHQDRLARNVRKVLKKAIEDDQSTQNQTPSNPRTSYLHSPCRRDCSIYLQLGRL